jgi:hypothetical protein
MVCNFLSALYLFNPSGNTMAASEKQLEQTKDLLSLNNVEDDSI